MAQARLYGFDLSHPTLMARVMLDIKGIDYRLVETPVGLHNVIIHLYGFRGSTVPALRLADAIARTDDARDRAQTRSGGPRTAAGRRGRRVGAGRGVGRHGLPEHSTATGAPDGRALGCGCAATSPTPARCRCPTLQARLTGPVASLLARVAGAPSSTSTADLRAFPETMDEVDTLLTGGVARTDPPDALALQLILTTKTLWRYPQLRPILEGRPSTKLALAVDVPLTGDVGDADAARVGGGRRRLTQAAKRSRSSCGASRAELTSIGVAKSAFDGRSARSWRLPPPPRPLLHAQTGADGPAAGEGRGDRVGAVADVAQRERDDVEALDERLGAHGDERAAVVLVPRTTATVTLPSPRPVSS